MTKFSDLKLDPKVLQAVAEAGYETPTPIQAGAIPPALEGRDVLGIAQTGTGKTAGFVLPMITLLGRGRARARMPRSLVLCPTRELAAQVAENFDTYAKHTRLTKALLIGGVSFGEQDKLIDRGVDVLIATPGRLLDHFERGKLLLTGVQIMVVDEADRMLDMGFIPDIERIFQLTPPLTRQTLFFSATMAPEIERITNTFLHNPERIEVARQATASETIVQKLVEIVPTRKDQTAKQKRELLRALIDAEGPEAEGGSLKNAIIFCNRKTEVDVVAKSLKAHGYDAAPIHGDLDQSQRTRTLEGFREGSLRFLIASDVAARGLDIPAVSHVFNFDLPSHAEDYVHRIGRTGRAGRTGTAISIATPSDDKYLAAIENLVKQTLPRAPVPDGFSLSEAAGEAPRPASDRGGRAATSRTRSRVRGERTAERPDRKAAADAVPLAEAATATPDLADQPEMRAEPRSEARPEPRRRDEEGRDRTADRTTAERSAERGDERRDRGTERRAERAERPEDRRDDRRGERGLDRRSERGDERRGERGEDRRGRDRDRGPALLGMGEHVPDFLLTSFAPSIAATAARMSAADAAAEPGAAEPPQDSPQPHENAAAAPVTQEAPDERAKDNDRAKDNAAQDTPETGPQDAPAKAEKPKRTRTRARKKPAAEAASADEATAAQDGTADTATPDRASQQDKDSPQPGQSDGGHVPEEAAATPLHPLPEEREATAPDAAQAEAAPAVPADLPPDALPEEREAVAVASVPAEADTAVPHHVPPMTQDGLDAHDSGPLPAAPPPSGEGPQAAAADRPAGDPSMTEPGLDAHADAEDSPGAAGP